MSEQEERELREILFHSQHDVEMLNEMNAQLRKEVEALKKQIEIKDGVIKNDCETEEVVKKLARPFLPAIHVDGNKYGVPNEADIVDELIKSFQKEVEALRRDKEIPWNDDVREIMGVVCFVAAPRTKRLVELGAIPPVKPKAEDEQAAFIHWAMNLYLKYGKDWKVEGEKILRGEPTPTTKPT